MARYGNHLFLLDNKLVKTGTLTQRDRFDYRRVINQISFLIVITPVIPNATFSQEVGIDFTIYDDDNICVYRDEQIVLLDVIDGIPGRYAYKVKLHPLQIEMLTKSISILVTTKGNPTHDYKIYVVAYPFDIQSNTSDFIPCKRS